jgi:O-antigen/teichoic acid export membrane protein
VTEGAPASSQAESRWQRARAALFARDVRSRILTPVGFNAGILAMNLVTGIVVARALGPAGRGEIAAILLVAQLAVWIFSGGAQEAVAYRYSKREEDGARLLGTWFAIGVPLALVAIAVAELALPVLFAAQTQEAIDFGRVYVPIVIVMLLQTVLYGILLGAQDFLFYNFVRFVHPAAIAIAYIVLWVSDGLTVEAALVVNAVSTGVAFAFALGRSLSRTGVAAPSLSLARQTLSYGLRAHLGSIAGLVNARIDLLIIPAFLAAAGVGLYSVATNVTSIIGTLTGTIAVLVLPVAARASGNGEHSARTVIRTLHAVLLIGVAIALPLGLLADVALSLVYGDEFGEAATAMRILLPGEVLDAAAMVLWSALLAANRPFLSSVAAAPAAILTVVGLVLFLETGGIDAAAMVTTVAYTVVFVLSVVLYKHVASLRWRDFVTPPAQ